MLAALARPLPAAECKPLQGAPEAGTDFDGLTAMRVGVATDSTDPTFVPTLRSQHDVLSFSLDETDADLSVLDSLIVSADLRQAAAIAHIRRIVRSATNARQRLFLMEKMTHAALVQAYSLGATEALAQSTKPDDILRKVSASSQAGKAADTGEANGDLQSVFSTAAHLASMFLGAANNNAVTAETAQAATDVVYDSIASRGLTMWIDNVRRHHTGTFQHCMLVTGFAVDFAQSLGSSRSEAMRLGVMATLHDIGKAQIPVAILDKPGKLDDDERAVIQGHPALGFRILSGTPGISAEILDGVLHHHELLDGSGYPDGLAGGEIKDLVRMLTISDIFAALVENRGYKPPLPRNEAYQILRSMDGKLEQPLVTAFRKVALER